MPCAAEHRPRGRRRAARCVAVLAAACLLAACTAGPAGSKGGGAGRWALSPAHRFIGRHVIIISGAGGGGGPAIFIGGTGGGGSRPKITMPPIPPARSSVTILLPLDAYQAISTQQQKALAAASALLIQRCMAARGFEDTSSASPPFSSVVTLEQVETSGTKLTSITQARTFGFVHPKNTGSRPSGPQIIGIVGAAGFNQALKAGHACRGAVRVRPGHRDRPGRSPRLHAAGQQEGVRPDHRRAGARPGAADRRAGGEFHAERPAHPCGRTRVVEVHGT